MSAGGFADIDESWAAFEQDNPSWLACGVDAVERVCATLATFTTVDVWREWRGPRPEEPRRMAEVMDEAIRIGLCVRVGVTAGHSRQAGHAGFGALYRPLVTDAVELAAGNGSGTR